MGNTFGRLFRLTSFGESHGYGVGGVVDGCPPRLPLSEADLQHELDRRRPGQSSISTPRKEKDAVRILSGLSTDGLTLGTPIGFALFNEDQRPSAYDEMREKYRPSHADFTYDKKFGIRAAEGGGRSSARETIARVAAGAIARKALLLGAKVEIRAHIERIHTIAMDDALTRDFPTEVDVEANEVRCPDPAIAEQMIARIKEARAEGNSVGGLIVCRVRGLPVGWGEPVFDRLEADLAKAMMSLPATKGFEVGSGFAGTHLTGAEHNDLFESREGEIRTKTNRSGGVQGGISNGEELYFRVAFKPTATIARAQETVTTSGESTELVGKGRHDPCVVPRAVPIVEAMAALVLVDHWLIQRSRDGLTF